MITGLLLYTICEAVGRWKPTPADRKLVAHCGGFPATNSSYHGRLVLLDKVPLAGLVG